jgi:hypothetical protein
MADWKDEILEDDAKIRALLATTRRVAVLGMKTEAQADQAAFYVPKYLAERGVEVVPVPVYYPEVEQILGRPVFRKVADVPWRRGRGRSGCSSGSETTSRPRRSRGRGSRSCRTAA